MDNLDIESAKLAPTGDCFSPSPKEKYHPSGSVPSFTAQTTMMYFVSTPSDIVSAGKSLCTHGYDNHPRLRNPLHIDQTTNTLGFR